MKKALLSIFLIAICLNLTGCILQRLFHHPGESVVFYPDGRIMGPSVYRY